MDVEDLRSLLPASRVVADVCIVGSGPVGLSLASELSSSGRSLLVLESGGLDPDEHADNLNAIESVGSPRVMDQTLVRNRVFGGTSHSWSGRLATLDDIDFEERSWLAGSGWPIARSEISRCLPRTLSHLGGAIEDNNDPALKARVLGQVASRFDPTLLDDYLWSYSRDDLKSGDFMRFGPRALGARLPNVRCFVYATVTHIDTLADGSAVTGLEVTGLDGFVRRVVAQVTILCAGGIENARLLLASNRIMRGGVGNAHDRVGRCLMDHPRGAIASFAPEDFVSAQQAFSSFRCRIDGRRAVVTRGVALSRSLQEREELLNSAAWLNGVVAGNDPLVAAKDLLRLRAPKQAAVDLLRQPKLLLSNARRLVQEKRSPVRLLRSLELECIVEQAPDAESRVTLSKKTDAFGTPISRIDWRMSEAEGRSVRALARTFVHEAKRLGLPVPRLSDAVRDESSPLGFLDVAHPIGTTGMSTDPRLGVVDRNCAVHGVCNLYVAGSSVFTTSGHANPTQTAVALAVRLADHLKSNPPLGSIMTATQQSAPSAPEHSAAPVRPRSGRRACILVTGGGGRLGSHLVQVLLQRGYEVRALTSRLRPPATVDGLQWIVHDLRRPDFDFSVDVEGCDAVLHLGAELRHPSDMPRVNIDATAALARAAESVGVRFMCYTSSVSVYGSGRKRQTVEDSPKLTVDRDVPSEYWADDALRAYGRTKLAGELAIAQQAKTVEYVIYRPTVIVDIADVVEIAGWGAMRRSFLAYRNAHHIYVLDAVEAIIWAMERSLARDAPLPGVSIFNLSDDTLPDPTYGSFLQAVYDASPTKPFKPIMALPGVFDWFKNYIYFRRSIAPKRVMGAMSYPSRKLANEGFRLSHGMALVRREAIKIIVAAQNTDGQA